MDTHTLRNGRIDIQEVVNSEICRREGAFDEEDVLKSIAERIQPYLADFTPEQNEETCRKIKSFLNYAMSVYTTSGSLKYVGKGKYRNVMLL